MLRYFYDIKVGLLHDREMKWEKISFPFGFSGDQEEQQMMRRD